MSDTSRTVLVTGGTGGLGRGVVGELAAAGWRVVAVDRDIAHAPAGFPAEVLAADLFEPAEARRAVAAAGDGLRAVVNLVGGFSAPGRVHETPVDDFEEQLRLNLRCTYLVCQSALPVLIAAGGGAIVCVSSRAALRPFSGAAGYVTAKAAVLAFVDALAVEYRDDRVRANAILPSVIDTPANRASMPDADFEHWVTPAEIGRVVEFLCSDASAPASGAHVPVYGRA